VNDDYFWRWMCIPVNERITESWREALDQSFGVVEYMFLEISLMIYYLDEASSASAVL